jgi:alanine-synthesizing transaminase
MFSRRFTWDLEQNRLARALTEKRRTGTQLFDLTESNPTRAGFSYPADEILSALIAPDALSYEPNARGLVVARRAVTGYYSDLGLTVRPEQILLTASTSESYGFLFKLLADPGDNVLVPAPGYPLFEFLSAFEAVTVGSYSLEYEHPLGWRIDFSSLESAITSRTRALLLVNPNNPTGSFVTLDDRRRVLELCRRKDIAVIVDEVFLDYPFSQSAKRASSFAGEKESLTFVLSGLSKVCGLPQMKLGWIVMSGPEGISEQAAERLELIADTYLSVSTPVQHAATQWLAERGAIQRQIRDRIKTNLDLVEQFVESSPCRLLKADGGWYAVLEVPRNRSEEELVFDLLVKDNVIVHPGYFFDFAREAFMILSLLQKTDVFEEGTRRMLYRL